MNPNTDALTTTGGVVAQGGFPYAALFEAVSPRKGVVIVRLPKNPITLTRVGGTETMTVSSWTISGGGNSRNVASQEPFSFAIGGTLAVNANQAEGLSRHVRRRGPISLTPRWRTLTRRQPQPFNAAH
jgi:hypothetical protein